MAITGRFLAEFGSFYDAVTKAELKLVDLNKGAATVGTSLDRMTTSFSGRKVVQEALLMEKAIGGVVGLSKLTEAELRKVGATASEAVEKLKRLGLDVPPGLQKIHDTAQPIPSMFSKMTSALGPLGPMVAATFSIGAVVGFGKAIFADADALVKLHDKTGIAYGGLQDLRAIAAASGNSFEQVTSAISMMQNRISSGDASAVSAIRELGLSFDALRAMSPDQQFRAIGAALKEIPDPADRVRLAMDAMGRSGAELLPTLLADMDAIAAGTVKMADKTIENIDRAGDAITKWYANLKGSLANAVIALADFAKASDTSPVPWWTPNFMRMNRQAPEGVGGNVKGAGIGGLAGQGVPLTIGAAAAAIGMPTPAQMEEMDVALSKLSSRVKEQVSVGKTAASEAKTRAAAFATLTSKVHELEGGLAQVPDVLRSIGRSYDESKLADLAKSVQLVERDARQLAFSGLRGITTALEALGERAKVTMDDLDWTNVVVGPMQSVEDKLRAIEEKASSMGQVLKSIPDTLIAAFTGGGGIVGALQAIAVQFGNSFADTLRATIKKNLDAGGTGLTASGAKSAGGLGALAGLGTVASGGSARAGVGSAAMAGAAVGVGALTGGATLAAAVALGAATLGIGTAAVVAYVAVKKLLNDPEKKVNPIRQAFVDAAGGLAELNLRAVGAGATLTAMLDAKTPQAYEAAIRQLNAAFEFQDASMKFLDETVKKYGFSLSELGPKLGAKQMAADAGLLVREFRGLEAAGLNVEIISGKMKDGIQAYLTAALQTGQAVPESMREILNQMATMGLLTDLSGDKIGDLEDAGIKFAKNLDAQIETLLGSIQKLIDAISRGLGGAIAGLPSLPDLGGSGLPDPDVVGAARGGIGRVTKPTLFLAGEAGAEDFAFSGGGRRFGRTSAAAPAPVTVNIYGGRFNTPSDRLRAANEISQALMDEQRLERRLNVA